MNEDESSEVYIFSFKIREKERLVEEGTVQVNASDYAILRVDRTLYKEDNFAGGLPEGSQLVDNKINTVCKYKKIEAGRYALSYSGSEWMFKFAMPEGEMHTYTLTNDFLVTDYNSEHKRIMENASVYPFKIAKNIKIVDMSELKHLVPDYEFE